VVELPGETDPEEALAVLRQTGLLEFVDFSALTDQEIQTLLNSQTKIKTDFGLSEEDASIQPTPSSTETITSSQTITNPLASLSDTVFHTIMTGADLKTAAVTTNQANQYEISFDLTENGAGIFADHTAAHVGDVLAIVLDKEIISAPGINQPIPDGRGVIQGNFDQESANALAVQLRYGSLPIPLVVVETRTVGPTLGQDSLQKSMLAGMVGFIIVVLFMIIYYRLSGLMAVLSILIYALIVFAIFRGVPVTLTLAGIAGFLLSTGSALDANILIFERIKEELRAGKNLKLSLDLAFKRARPAIIDSNIATLITCAILFWFGSTFGATIVKGFSITLAIGVGVSLFTAMVVTRTMMTLTLSNFKSTDYAKWFGI
jgi:preprotein translocase subunit SecD